MLTYSKLSKKPALFRIFTGLAVDEFDKLFAFIEDKYPEHEAKRLGKRKRTNAIGQGRPFTLELKDRLLMLLVYYRTYLSFALVGFLFNLDQSNVCRNIKHIEPLVKLCIPLPKKVYKKAKKIGTLEELLKYYPEMKAFIDATEQAIPRPKNKRRRKSYYSGKKKKHTIKTQITVNKKGLILHKPPPDKGSRHDYDIFKEKHPNIPPDIERDMDLGYQGVQDDFPDMKARIPRKKQRGKERTKEDKKFNKMLSRERVVVEHVIGKMKKFKVMGETFRNRLEGYDDVTSVVAGLVNFRTMLNEGFDLNEFVD
jgi:hypothetical protein